MKYKITFGIVAALILAGIVFSIFHRPNLFWSQKPPAPGSYIAKKQLANVGYSTPEAALETAIWAMMSVNYDKTIESPFKGMQIVAKKTIADDKVELKVLMEATSTKSPGNKYRLQTMAKIGNAWKVDGGTRGYVASWDNGSNIVTFVAQ